MKPIAFFCAEYGIEDNLPLYAGGLGILSGDFILEAGSQGLPFIAIGLFYRNGFINHNPDQNGDSTPLMKNGFQLVADASGQTLNIEIDIGQRIVNAQIWTRSYGTAKIYLIDTNTEKNSVEDRAITTHLYDSNPDIKMLQELVLGIGGVKLLRTLGIKPGIYHLNEGHTSFVALALAAEYLHDNPSETSFSAALDAIRPSVVATKHTILTGAGIFFTREQFKTVINHYFERHRIDFEEFFTFGTHEHNPVSFSTTRFLFNASIRSNSVSMIHAIFEKQRHPLSPLISITNGVYAPRWRSTLWPHSSMGALSDSELWSMRNDLRKDLVEYINTETGVKMNNDALTIVWARRFAAYKRPYLIFSDIERLAKILSVKDKPVQIIISGMAHSADKEGTDIVEKIKKHISEDRFKGKIVYVPQYSIATAKKLVAGADVWLNTPQRGIEACGTSGMKAGLNGGLQCSTHDGWVEEVDWTDKGWMLGEENIDQKLYNTIEQQIIPLFFGRNPTGIPDTWLKYVRASMKTIEERFTAKRMVNEYISKLYFPRG